MAQVIRLSHRHEAILNWLIANPEQKLEDCAREFGVTQPWLSSLIHCDLFQSALREKQAYVFGEISITVKDRITHLAHESLRRLTERIESGSVSNDQLIDSAELAVKSMGFGAPKPQGPINNNFVFQTPQIDASTLADARQLMYAQRPRLPQEDAVERVLGLTGEERSKSSVPLPPPPPVKEPA
jgi:hypothetical protein